MKHLPPFIINCDIREFETISPEAFSRKEDPEALRKLNSPNADKILKYSRLGDSPSYDEIAYRYISTMPSTGIVKLQTFQTVAEEQSKDARLKSDRDFEWLNEQEDYLEHRPFETFTEGKARYTVTASFLKLWNTANPEIADISWIFPLSNPPQFLLRDATDRDVAALVTQSYQINIPEVHWLPFATLVDTGKFEKMQEARSKLVRDTLPGCHYSFISHRWLTPVEPDPDGLQARLLAWQLLSYLAEAIRVAQQRGLMVPRKYNEGLNLNVGAAGSELAESLIVNVLRYQLNEERLAEAAEEIKSLPLIEEDYGISIALEDTGLQRLKGLINQRPVLKFLCEKIFVWYDYNCMPQRPFQDEDERIFRKNLELLNSLQHIGLTLILLDDPNDYLTRAWCVLEAVFADNETRPRWLSLVGADRPLIHRGKTEHYFTELLEDRPHILWRAILDTELFRIQDQMQCMRKLKLAATHDEDLPFIYSKLSDLKLPVKVHLDDTEVITGIFPVPYSEKTQTHLLATYSERALDFYASGNIDSVHTLDWTDILLIKNSLIPFKGEFSYLESAFVDFDLPGNYTPEQEAHLCVVGSCEAEAMLISHWVHRHLEELSNTLRLGIRSLSWLASDVAPVGKIVFGKLQAELIRYPNFILVGTQMRLMRGQTVNLLNNSLQQAGCRIIHFNLDLASDNLTVYKPSYQPAVQEQKAVAGEDLVVHNGGLFRWAVKKHLVK